MQRYSVALLAVTVLCLVVAAVALAPATQSPTSDFLGNAQEHARHLVSQGQQIFRFDPFGDEAFWGDQLGLQQVVASFSPRQALNLGLQVDAEALPPALVNSLQPGQVTLDDPVVTVPLV